MNDPRQRWSRENVWSIGRCPEEKRREEDLEEEGNGKRGRTLEDDDRIQRFVGRSVGRGRRGRGIHARARKAPDRGIR